ncbi:MAG: peptide deformylase [Gammaproteobacteria bacterium]|nr:peptide deformylase [Gammaproteobacteria bacterium]
MSIRKVLHMGQASLFQVSEEIRTFNTPELDRLINDMLDTMEDMNGAGLAAPQIGVNKRLVIFGIKENPRYPDVEPVPLTILINPVIEKLDDQMEDGWEGCLSIPGMRGVVPRYRNIRYRGVDQKGNVIDRKVSGFHARVVQHECDHLDGILYTQRIRDMKLFGFESELENKNTPED